MITIIDFTLRLAGRAIDLVVFCLTRPVTLLSRLIPLAGLADRVRSRLPRSMRMDVVERLGAYARKREPHNDLACGRRREAIEARAPADRYPLLYRSAPPELSYSLIADGRTLDGLAPAVALGPTTLDEAGIRAAHKRGWDVATAFTAFVLAIAIFATWSTVFAPVRVEAPVVAAVQAPRIAQDAWTAAELTQVQQALAAEPEPAGLSFAQKSAVWLATAGAALFKALLVAAALALLGYGIWRTMWLVAFKTAVTALVERTAALVRIDPRSAIQMWRYRHEQRELAQQAHASAIDLIESFDRSPTISLGTATGVMSFRQHLAAPMLGAPMRMSVLDLTQHLLVTGGSGEGKTRSVLKPVMSQLLDLRQQGYPISLYVTDGKAVLWRDFVEQVEKRGMQDKMFVIGTGPGQWRVDLLDKTSIVEFVEILESIYYQLNGKNGDPFWMKQALQLALMVGHILQCTDATVFGDEFLYKNFRRLNSIVSIRQYADDLDELLPIIEAVAAAQKDPEQYIRISRYDTPALKDAIDSYFGYWSKMPENTLAGIQATLRNMLESFTTNPEIGSGFADGAGDSLLDIDSITSDSLTAINVSAVEHGTAGRIVLVALKSLLFRRARAAEAADPTSSERRLAWWSQPDLANVSREHYFNVFVADEYQDLVTMDLSSGYSDNFWAVARSAGVIGVISTQTLSSFEQVIGRENTQAFIGNLRSKIFMRSEDVGTIEYAKRLVGKTVRFESAAWNAHESADAHSRETSFSPDALPVIMNPQQVVDHAGVRLGEPAVASYADAYAFDGRFLLRAFTLQQRDEAIASEQAATWRFEDRNAALLQHGRHDVDALRDEDIVAMGRGRAVVLLQRAGVTRVDIATVG